MRVNHSNIVVELDSFDIFVTLLFQGFYDFRQRLSIGRWRLFGKPAGTGRERHYHQQRYRYREARTPHTKRCRRLRPVAPLSRGSGRSQGVTTPEAGYRLAATLAIVADGAGVLLPGEEPQQGAGDPPILSSAGGPMVDLPKIAPGAVVRSGARWRPTAPNWARAGSRISRPSRSMNAGPRP